jgi:hypothetical protein
LLIARLKGHPPAFNYDTHGGVEAQYKLRLLIFTIWALENDAIALQAFTFDSLPEPQDINLPENLG